MTEVPGVKDNLHALVLGGEAAKLVDSSILRTVVDVKVLVIVLREPGEDFLYLTV